MERLKTLTTLVWMLAILLACELVFLVSLVRPQSFALWVTFIVIAISCLYLVGVTLGLLRELKNPNKE